MLLVKWFLMVRLVYLFMIFWMVVCVLCGCRFSELLMKYVWLWWLCWGNINLLWMVCSGLVVFRVMVWVWLRILDMV